MNNEIKPGIFFDLDGTLTDPYLGISRSIAYALDALDSPKPDDYRWCIGPPLLDTFAELVGEQRAEAALVHYRERFADIGWKENSVYAGIPSVLKQLAERGHPLFVATSKPHVYATRILKHFDLSTYFVEIFGSELSGERTDKTELLSFALDRHPQAATMIGDRRHDIIGAKNNRLQSVGVSYGFGGREELLAAKADILVDAPDELAELEFCSPVGR